MRKPTQQEIDEFIKYRSLHVALVQKLGKVCFDMNFSDHDSDKINATGKELELLALRNVSKKKNLHFSKEEENELRKVSARHAKNQKHHAEYWDPSITIRNFKADDTNVIVAKSLPKRYIAEMACDWAACALHNNEPILSWYNRVIDNTLFLTEGQKQYLLECLKKIEKEVVKNNIHFPEKEYNCKQVKSLKEDESIGGGVSASNFEGMTPEKISKIIEPLKESEINNRFENSFIFDFSEENVKKCLASFDAAYEIIGGYNNYKERMDKSFGEDPEAHKRKLRQAWPLWVEKVGPALLGKGDITIYRGLKTLKVNTKRLGNCWTMDKQRASKFGSTVITGTTSKDNVDKVYTIFAYIMNYLSLEYEVRLWLDDEVNVLNIE